MTCWLADWLVFPTSGAIRQIISGCTYCRRRRCSFENSILNTLPPRLPFICATYCRLVYIYRHRAPSQGYRNTASATSSFAWCTMCQGGWQIILLQICLWGIKAAGSIKVKGCMCKNWGKLSTTNNFTITSPWQVAGADKSECVISRDIMIVK